MSGAEFIGRDPEGDLVWSIGDGRIVGGVSFQEAEFWAEAQAGRNYSPIGYALADYERKFGPITREPL